ncbi:hypothetical protein OSH11_18605 [Kaistia dalseonensis]|uniref:Uncharacterized protein n=1 Tax=Kaistia dalseonensis TaxID=410840 RepID=A0ABU0HAQ8_9HYPH|nr:hypothetical protein [Kaistia dalseonensis]MCX5496724.1 hypothetical protein [Kaistia dalseonensis]MDQ0439350.1 hypothetical protein [Kaistia dalseonensis]
MTTNYEQARSGGNSSFGNTERPSDIQGDKSKPSPRPQAKETVKTEHKGKDEKDLDADRFIEQGGASGRAKR